MLPTVPDLSSKQLRAVQAVARYSSFIAASAELRISQPGLSRIIRSVEQELGTALFHRSTRQVTLTPAGAEFLPIVERILHDFAMANETISSLRDQKRGHVSIGCPMSIANRVMPHIVTQYRRRHPNVAIEIREGLQGEVLSDIRSGAIDFGIAIAMEPDDDLVVDVLCDTTYHVIFRNDHRFAALKKVPLTALRDEPLISLPASSNLRWVFEGAAAQAGFRLHHAITVNTYNTIFEFVRGGEGVSILNGAGVGFAAHESILSRRIDPPLITAQLAVMHLKARPLSPAAIGLMHSIENYFRANPAT